MRTVQLLLLTAPIGKARARKFLERLKQGVAGVEIRQIGSYPKQGEIPLTSRQAEVLRAIVCGATVKEIAKDLGISSKTVETHRAQLMERLGIRRIPDLVRYAIQIGLISPSWLANPQNCTVTPEGRRLRRRRIPDSFVRGG